MRMTPEENAAFLSQFAAAAKDNANSTRLTILRRAVTQGYYVNFRDNRDYCALAYAAENNRIDCVVYLLSIDGIRTDLDVYESDDEIGGIPLHIAAFRGHTEIIQLLLQKSPAEINTYDFNGFTPLQEAVLGGQFAAFKLLMRSGADDEVETKKGLNMIPKGINTLQLITYRTGTEKAEEVDHAQALLDMWRYLIREKLRNGEPIEGHSKWDDDDYEDEEEEDISDIESVGSLMRRTSEIEYRTVYEAEVRRNNENPIEGDDFSDTDSEWSSDYTVEDMPPERISLDTNAIAPVDQPVGNLVLHARGEHFYTNVMAYSARKRYVMFSHAAPDATTHLAAWGTYSRDVHARAGISYDLPTTYDPTRDQRLEQAAATTRAIINTLRAQTNVIPLLARDSRTSRQQYSSRLIELVQRYVNSYRTLSEDMRTARVAAVNNRQSARTREKQRILVQLRGLPFVSFSEDIEVGAQYATGYLNYDKTKTHRPHASLDFTLTPQYRVDGDLKHPYLGVIYITLHTQASLADCSLDIAELFRDNLIDPSKGPGTHETSGYVRALERIFFAGVDKHHICLAKIVRLPNLYYPYRSFVSEKYGLTRERYDLFKSQIARFGKINAMTGKMVNEVNFYRAQEELIGSVIQHQRSHMIASIQAWAETQGVVVGTLNEAGEFQPNLAIDIKEKIRRCNAIRNT